MPLAYSEHLTGIAILALPFYAIGLAPVVVYNIAMLIGFALSGYGGFVLARVVARRPWPSLLGGALYGFVPYRFGQLPHVQVVSGGWLPLLLAALLIYRRNPTWRNAALFGAAFVMNGLTNVYFFLFGSTAIALTIVLIAIAERRDRTFWLRAGSAIIVAIAVLLPFLIPYQIVSQEYGMKRGVEESNGASATWNDWLIAPAESAMYGRIISGEQRHNERQLFPGVVMLLLAAAAFLAMPRRDNDRASLPPRSLRWLDALIVLLSIVTFATTILPDYHSYIWAMLLAICIVVRFAIRFPRAISQGNLRTAIAGSRFSFELWAASLWILAGVIGSLGMGAFFHAFLFHKVLPFRAIRVPARWASVAYVGLSAWAAAGASLVRRRWIVVALCVAAIVESWPRIRWEHAITEPQQADLWLARTKAGPLFELPIERINALYLWELRSTTHHVPIFDGISGFEPPLHRTLREEPLTDRTYALLEGNGAHYILVRPDWCGFGWLDVAKWLQRGIAGQRVAFVRRFDGGINGDWLFALTRNEKNWQRYRVPGDDAQLARLFAGKTPYNGATFGQLYQPKSGAQIQGALIVSGWALSPRGVREVNVLLDNGRTRIPAGLFARADVSQNFPFYPRTTKPAFAISIPRRPRHVPDETDLQIEIVDGSGSRTLLPDVLITWR
ncbi:MAG TPA: hypothetical protein VJ853_13115 [Thermoanaerobaculia bacterium]|nr:hypothetical protein [Thermoanaerobaculia bacterium]